MKTTVNGGPARRPVRDTMQLDDLSALAAMLRKAAERAKDDRNRRRSVRYADAAATPSS
jgi:hypothetical protein